MARVVAAFGSSHASTYLDPEHWETFRQRVRGSYERRYVTVPPERPEIERETVESLTDQRNRPRGVCPEHEVRSDRVRALSK